MNFILPERLKFPVLLIGPQSDRTVEIVTTLEHLTTSSKLGLKQQSILNCILIDQKGQVAEISSISKKKNKNPFWKFEFFNPMVELEILLKEAISQPDLSEIKEHVKFAINQNPSFWRQTADLTILKEKIDQSTSISSVMKCLETIF